MVFIDVILIYLRTTKKHTHHLRTILEVLGKKKLYAKLKKYEFWLGNVAFLGHVVSREEIFMDPQKIKGIKWWPRPKNATKVRSWL